jgi:hypothetical protein
MQEAAETSAPCTQVASRRREKEHGEISGRKKTPWLEGERQMGECGDGEEGVIAS